MDRMGQEEVAVWLEEMAARIRSGTLTVDGERLDLPAQLGSSVKSKTKDGHRRLKLEIEWPEEPGPAKTSKKDEKKNEKKGKKKSKQDRKVEKDEKTPEYAQDAASKQETGGPGPGTNGSVHGGEAVETARSSGKCGSVRDYDSHVLVCKGGDCSKKGGRETKKALKSGLRAEGLNGDVRVDSVECLGLCKQGPNVIVYPEGSWYLGLKEGDVPEVVEKHLAGGEPVERLAAERRPRKGAAQKAKG